MILKWINGLLKDRNRATANGVSSLRKISTGHAMGALLLTIFVND